MTMVVELYDTQNSGTKSGLPLVWRWKLYDDRDDIVVAKSKSSHPTEDRAHIDASRHAVVPKGAILRRPAPGGEHVYDSPWVAHL